MTSLQLPEVGKQREVLGSGRMGMAQSCAKGGSQWVLGDIYHEGDQILEIPEEVVDVLCLLVLKRHLDNILNNMP